MRPLLSEAATAHSETFLILERIAPAPSESGSSWRGEYFSGGIMSERRIIPVAYVTKWAATAGIRIVRNGEVTDAGALSNGFLYVSAKDWTEDKALAEARYRARLEAAIIASERKTAKLINAHKAAPKYTEG